MISTLHGKNVVITGVVPGYTRPEAEALIAQAGAHIQKSVTKSTDILIFGDKVGQTKINAAKKWGSHTIPWSDALRLAQGAPPVMNVPAPSPPKAQNQPVAPQQGYRQVNPQLCKQPPGATPEEQLPKSGEWLYEIKWDGYRCVAHLNGQTILASRSGKDFARYEHIIEDLDGLQVSAILDGELIVPEGDGGSNLERLHKGEIESVRYVVFDVLEAQGTDIRREPLSERKRLLEQILEGAEFCTVSPTFAEEELDGLVAFVDEEGLEGIVAKRAASHYKEGARNGDWLKIKWRMQQEFVVVGYTEGQGARAGTAGAFLLAVNDGNKRTPKWLYVGDVGSGGTYDQIEEVRAATSPLTPQTAAIDIKTFTKAQLREITFVKPEIVVDVKFQRWTEDGKLWHPSLQGMRDDKTPKEVVRET